MGLGKLSRKGILMVLYLAIFVLTMQVEGEVYKVGDSAGWTDIGHVDYTTWSDTKHFHVGDTILFEYNKQFHNVVRVTHKNYRACNGVAHPNYGTLTTGNDSFTVNHPGHYFFICSHPGHCQAGQKVNIRVPSHPAPAPEPHSTPSPSPSPTNAPPPKNGGSPPTSKLWLITLVLSAFCVSGIAY